MAAIREIVATHDVRALVVKGRGPEAQLLVIDSKSILSQYRHKGTSTKLPGGTNREKPTESVRDTLTRETLEETDLLIRRSAKVEELCRADRSETHTQVFLLVRFEDCDNILRKDPKEDDGDLLSPPRWILVSEASRELFHKHHIGLTALICHGV